MLFGENLGGCHQRHLVTSLQGLQCRQCGDHCLAGADIALDQAHHWLGLGEVVGDLVGHTLLSTGRLETQVAQVLRRQPSGLGQDGGAQAAQALAQPLL
ncbi:hypothetical protein D3C81_1360950 [compost metagenome]